MDFFGVDRGAPLGMGGSEDWLPSKPPVQISHAPEPPCPRCDRKAAPEHVRLQYTETEHLSFMGTRLTYVYACRCWHCENTWQHKETK